MNSFLGKYNLSISTPKEIEISNWPTITNLPTNSHFCPPPTKRKRRKGINLSLFHREILLQVRCRPHCMHCPRAPRGGQLWGRGVSTVWHQQLQSLPPVLCATTHVCAYVSGHEMSRRQDAPCAAGACPGRGCCSDSRLSAYRRSSPYLLKSRLTNSNKSWLRSPNRMWT